MLGIQLFSHRFLTLFIFSFQFYREREKREERREKREERREKSGASGEKDREREREERERAERAALAERRGEGEGEVLRKDVERARGI